MPTSIAAWLRSCWGVTRRADGESKTSDLAWALQSRGTLQELGTLPDWPLELEQDDLLSEPLEWNGHFMA